MLNNKQIKTQVFFFKLTHKSNLTPCARGRSFPKLIVQVDLLMYCFQESEPLSRPPPVSFSPPKAPPISAPEGPILTFTIPVSAPRGPVHLKRFWRLFVNKDAESPYGTELLI